MFNNSIVRNFVVISFFSILITRLIPHPPNFTATIAIAFYLPALFGVKYFIVALTAFILSDILIGLHNLVLFTWGSLLLIGLFSKYLQGFYYRILGVSGSCLIFFLVSNFGVWFVTETYANDLSGLISCYVMALPFLKNTLISSFVISIFIESLVLMKLSKTYISKINSNFTY